MTDPDSLPNPAWQSFMDLTDNQVAENMNSSTGGHQALSATDPDNPRNWPLHRKLYVSSVSFAFVFAL